MAGLPPLSTAEDAISTLDRRLEVVEQSLSERLLPPGYVVNEVSGNIVIRRKSDGTTSTLVFA